jgi:hypothetical protein
MHIYQAIKATSKGLTPCPPDDITDEQYLQTTRLLGDGKTPVKII